MDLNGAQSHLQLQRTSWKCARELIHLQQAPGRRKQRTAARRGRYTCAHSTLLNGAEWRSKPSAASEDVMEMRKAAYPPAAGAWKRKQRAAARRGRYTCAQLPLLNGSEWRSKPSAASEDVMEMRKAAYPPAAGAWKEETASCSKKR